MYWVYSVWCDDGSIYTGFSDDVKRRIYAHYHKLKTAAKYTKSHSVTGIAAIWNCDCESAARKLEYRIKHLEREKKLLLINEQERVFDFFPELSEYNITKNTDIKFEDCI